MAAPIRIAILANSRQARRELDATQGRLQRLGGIAKRAAGIGAVGFGVTALAVKAVAGSASDAEQSIGATESVFKKYADTVVKRSKKAAGAIGLSANEYRELSTVTGAMLKNSGMPLRKVTDLTDKLNRRAADLAATFGGETKDAVAAVSSLLRGEADPIERYGVSIKQSDVNARLAAQGLSKLEGKARKQAEQQARLTLLFEQTSDAAGQFKRESNTLAGVQQRLSARVENVRARLGTALLPALVKVAGVAEKRLLPTIERWIDQLEDAGPEIAATGREVANTGRAIGRALLPPLKTLATVTRNVVGFVADLPSPIKEAGVQAGIAALVLPRLAASATAVATAFTTTAARARQLRAELTYTELRGQRAAGVLSRLGGVARNAAGVGGMVALAQGATTSDRALGALMTTAGAAAAGFSVGGPWGAAIGAAGGGLYALYDATRASGRGMAEAQAPTQTFADTLDQVTGASTRATRALALQKLEQAGALTAGRALGVATRDLVGAALGQEGALRRVNAALEASRNANGHDVAGVLEGLGARRALARTLGIVTNEFEREQAAARQAKADTDTWRQALEGLPKRVRVELRNLNYQPTRKQVTDLQRRYDLTPKQVRTIFRAVGTRGVERDAGKVGTALRKAGDMRPVETSVLTGLTRVTRIADRSGATLGRTLRDRISTNAKFSPSPLVRSLGEGITSARTRATTDAPSIGTNLAAGAALGIRTSAGRVIAEATAMVRQALAAARAEAEIRSPSRKTRTIGEQLGQGLVIGLGATRPAVRRSMRKLIGSITSDAGDGRAAVLRSIEKRLDRTARRTIARHARETKDAKARAAFEKRVTTTKRATIKALRDEARALARNGNMRAALARRIDAAEQLLADRRRQRDEYAAGVRQGVNEYTNIANLGAAFNPEAIVAELRKRLDKVRAYSQLVQTLIGRGLNKTMVDQLAQAGVEGGLATATALAQGGPAVIAEVNKLQAAIGSEAAKLGDVTAKTQYQAGVNAALGMVKGLRSQAKALAKAARGLARDLVKEIKKALGIKSPSRVFAGLGRDTLAGLRIGLADTAGVRRAMVNVADVMTTSYRPKPLAAIAQPAAAGGAAPTRVEITVNVPPTANPVATGREVQRALDAYYRAGGRAAA